MGVLPRLLRSGLRRGQHRRRAVHAAQGLTLLLAVVLAYAPPLQAEVATGNPLGSLRAAGTGTYTWWGFEIYRASLWVDPAFNAAALPQQRFGLELQYSRAFTGRDIAQRSIEEMRRIGRFSEAQARAWQQAMQSAFPDVAAGDRLLGLHLPGQGARFLHNGRPVGDINDPEFARLFFGIWLSEQTSAPALRQALLASAALR